jgi:hypothetical protein
MNRNAKIGIGCGAVGCLGLIVLGIAGAVLYYWTSTQSTPDYRANRNVNINVDSNSNSNSNSNSTPDSNSNENTEVGNSNSSDSTSSYSDDDKHKLFQAAGMAQDADLLQKVMKKTGLFKDDGTPADGYQQFIKDHFVWAVSNTAFIESVKTPEKARAYIDAHL